MTGQQLDNNWTTTGQRTDLMAAKNGLLTVFVRALYNKKTEMQLLRLHRDITRGTTKTISMKTREVVEYLNSRFLPVYQESYDNAGFLVGDLEREVTGVLVALDVTESVVDEAIETGANLIVSHHPLIFGIPTSTIWTGA